MGGLGCLTLKGLTPLPPELADDPEFKKKLKAASRVVNLAQSGFLLFVSGLSSIGYTRPEQLKANIVSGKIGPAAAVIIMIACFVLGLILFLAAVILGSKAGETGVPLWKMLLPFKGYRLAVMHLRDDFNARNPHLLPPHRTAPSEQHGFMSGPSQDQWYGHPGQQQQQQHDAPPQYEEAISQQQLPRDQYGQPGQQLGQTGQPFGQPGQQFAQPGRQFGHSGEQFGAPSGIV